MTSTTFEIGRKPAAVRRAFIQSGEGPTVDVLQHARGEARAQIEVVDRDLHELRRRARSRRLGLALVERSQAQVEHRRDVAGDAADREQVGPVRQDLEVEHDVAEREARRERLAGGVAVAEDQDARVLVGELELALGEDHAVRQRAAQLRALELASVRQTQTRECDRDRVAGPEVPGAAHDLAGLRPSRVDLAELEAVGVRMLAGLEHEAGDDQLIILLGQPVAGDLLDLDPGERDPGAELGEGRQRILEVVLQPAQGDLHRRPPANCSRKRRSSS